LGREVTQRIVPITPIPHVRVNQLRLAPVAVVGEGEQTEALYRSKANRIYTAYSALKVIRLDSCSL
jgi:hypothetical protein